LTEIILIDELTSIYFTLFIKMLFLTFFKHYARQFTIFLSKIFFHSSSSSSLLLLIIKIYQIELWFIKILSSL